MPFIQSSEIVDGLKSLVTTFWPQDHLFSVDSDTIGFHSVIGRAVIHMCESEVNMVSICSCRCLISKPVSDGITCYELDEYKVNLLQSCLHQALIQSCRSHDELYELCCNRLISSGNFANTAGNVLECVHAAVVHIIHASGRMDTFAESPLLKIGLPSVVQYEADVSIALGHMIDMGSNEIIMSYRECLSMVCPIANNSKRERFGYLAKLPQLWSHTGMQLQKQGAVYAVMPAASSALNEMCRMSLTWDATDG